jgi:hypothetical protein
VDEGARLMHQAILRDLGSGLPIDRDALVSEIPGAETLDVDVALDLLIRSNLVRIAPPSGVEDAPRFELTESGRSRAAERS